MNINEKLDDIFNIIQEIKESDPGMAAILLEGFGLSLRLIETVSITNSRENIDISEHLEIVASVLGVSIKDLVTSVINDMQTADGSDKAPDAETLDFITSNVDDYEKFLAQATAKEDLDFLSKVI